MEYNIDIVQYGKLWNWDYIIHIISVVRWQFKERKKKNEKAWEKTQLAFKKEL